MLQLAVAALAQTPLSLAQPIGHAPARPHKAHTLADNVMTTRRAASTAVRTNQDHYLSKYVHQKYVYRAFAFKMLLFIIRSAQCH